jgi:TonB family protein
MAKALSHSKQKTVVVFDFVGPGKTLKALGQKLADDFSSALAKSSAEFTVGDRFQICEALKKNYLAPQAIQDLNTAWYLAQALQTQGFIMGKLSIEENNLVVEAEAFRASNGIRIEKFERVVVPLREEMNTLLGKIAEEKQEDPLASFPSSGTNGYSIPACLLCPNPQLSDEAGAAKMNGTMILEVVVGADGRAHHIRIIQPLPCGLTEKTIEAVKGWVFKPATGPDGNPAAVRQRIEARFHIDSDSHKVRRSSSVRRGRASQLLSAYQTRPPL